MSSQNQVGFSITGDVVGGSSLVYAATGRLLKALSDGGIDFYAVSSAIQLGKTIPISATREQEITGLVRHRGGRRGFLTKALYLGWGYSDVAVEFVRTRAGASALLTLGALATGSTAFIAAQAFTEMLRLAGFEEDMLPTADAVKPMITYLAPFVGDNSFRNILEAVTTAATAKCSKLGEHTPPGLIMQGDAADWSRALHQLIFSASRREDAYLMVKQRGAWLAAFAAYGLNMAVRLMLADHILWECASTSGSVVLQLSESAAESLAIKNFVLIPAPQTLLGQRHLNVTYEMGQALTKVLSSDIRIDLCLAEGIQRAISRLLLTAVEYITFKMEVAKLLSHPDSTLTGRFPGKLDLVKSLDVWAGTTVEEVHGLAYLDEENSHALRVACGAHTDYSEDSTNDDKPCLCSWVGGIIHAVGVTAVALIPCTYDSNALRVDASLISGKKTTTWSKKLVCQKGQTLAVNSRNLLLHISALIHGDDALEDTNTPDDYRLLGISAGVNTVYCKAILDSTAFDAFGRIFKVESGRISIRGLLRKAVVEVDAFRDGLGTFRGWNAADMPTQGTCTTLASGTQVVPTYIDGPMSIYMDAVLGEKEVIVNCSHNPAVTPQRPIPIMSAITTFLFLR